MEGSGFGVKATGTVANEFVLSEGTPYFKDWLHQTNQSLSRLKDVKQSTYRLGGGPKERENNCLCNHRSKSKESYLNTATTPPELSLTNQETASLPDTSVPELLKQFHERQKDTKIKRKQRPHTATSNSSRDATSRKNDKDKKVSLDQGAFIAVKGRTVGPKPRPASGSMAGAPSVTDNSSYKGMVHLDPQHAEETRKATIEGFRKYSATFARDKDEEPVTMPPAPRASPEPNSPTWGSMEELEKADEAQEDEFFSEDETSMDGSLEAGSLASRPRVFEIPTADIDYVSDDDDDESVSCTSGRLSTDYVAKSRVFLNELTEKNKKEAEELKDMFSNMEQMKTKISQLHISPRDLEELEAERRRTNDDDAAFSKASSVSVVNVHFDSDIIESEPLTEGSTLETFWVEERVPPVMSYALPTRNNRIRSASGREHAQGVKMKRQLSDDAMLLRGQTMSFLNSEDLAVSGRLRKSLPRRSTEPPGSLRALRSGEMGTKKKEGESSLPRDKKVTGRPPRPQTTFTKKKRSSSKDSHSRTADSSREIASDDNSVSVNCGSLKNSNPEKSSLKKCSSDSNIPKTVETCRRSSKGHFSSKKSVSFSQEVLSQGTRHCTSVHSDGEDKLSAGCEESQALRSTCCSDKSCDEGIVIKNGFEVKPEDGEGLGREGESVNESKPRNRAEQTDRAKILAKVKAATRCSCAPEECPCRNITRPTMGVIEDARAAGKSVPSPGLRLLKQRPSRPSSAPIRRAETGGEVSGVQRKPRVQSAHKRTTSEGPRSRPRPFSAHIQRPSNKESRRNHAAVKALKEGYLFKEKPVPASRSDLKSRRKKKGKPNDEAFEDVGFVWGQGEGDVAPSEECEEVYSRLKEKGLNVSMDTIKRGLMAPARRASEMCMTSLRPSSSSGLLSRPEKWLPDEYARIKVWDDVLKHAE